MSGRVPGLMHTGVYSSTLEYIGAVAKAGSKDPASLLKVLCGIEIEDDFARQSRLRADNLMTHEKYLAEVKAPRQSSKPQDVYIILGIVSGRMQRHRRRRSFA